MYLLIVALLVILCIVGITLFAVYPSLFAVVNLLRAAVIFSNKHPTITPINCICRHQLRKKRFQNPGSDYDCLEQGFKTFDILMIFSRNYSLVS